MKVILISVMILLTITLAGCQGANQTSETDGVKSEKIINAMNTNENSASEISSEEKKYEASEVIQENEIDLDESKEENDEVTLSSEEKKEVISKTDIWEFDDEQIAFSVSMGFPSPLEAIIVKNYEPKVTDAIYFDGSSSGDELFNSLRKKAFEGLTVVYEKNHINWTLFFEELNYSDSQNVLTVSLKEDNIYEEDYNDENSTYYRYYHQDEGVYYEVSDLMMATYTDGVEELTRQRMGTATYQGVLKNVPTYNPIILKEGELLLECFISEIDEQAVIYLESAYKEALYKRWISIEYGVVIKEFVFTKEGLIQEMKAATEITQTDIEESLFYPPVDVDYQDVTLMIYMAEGGSLEQLRESLINALPKDMFSVELKSDSGDSMMLHSSGYSGGQKLDEMVLVYDSEDELGKVVTLRNFRDGEYYHTICDDKKIVERYISSCDELKIFDFETTGFREIKTTDDTITYVFEDLGLGSVRGFRKFYAYEITIETNQLKNIQIYYKEKIIDNILQDIITYQLTEYGMTDEAIVLIPDDYKIYTNFLGEHYDGEYPAVWWRSEL